MQNVTKYFLFFLILAWASIALCSDTFSERPLAFTTRDGLTLHGTLTLASDAGKKQPVVLIMSDLAAGRDGAIGVNKPLADIARGLASRGTASYRFDRRSTSAQKDVPFVTAETDYVADALAAIDALKRVAEIDTNNIFAFGHGIGGFMMPFIATRSPRLRGVVLAGAPSRRIDHVLASKMRYRARAAGMDSAAVESQEIFVEMMFTKIAKGTAEKTQGFLGQSFAYWGDLYKRNPLLGLLDIKQPVLLVAGEKDFEATTEDFDKWRQMISIHDNPNDRSEMFSELNHLFNKVEGASTGAEYEKAAEVDKHFLVTLSAWIKKIVRR